MIDESKTSDDDAGDAVDALMETAAGAAVGAVSDASHAESATETEAASSAIPKSAVPLDDDDDGIEPITAEEKKTKGKKSAKAAPDKPIGLPRPLEGPPGKRWYIVKVQSGREDSIRNALERRVRIDGLEPHVGRIFVPTEKVTEVRNGKRVVKKRKKFPGYIMCEVEFTPEVQFLFRETAGVGDFVGGGGQFRIPNPMSEKDVESLLRDMEEDNAAPTASKDIVDGGKAKPKIIIPYEVGSRVKVRDGTFKDMEGDVKEIIEPPADSKENPKAKVELSIWGRPVVVEVEYWQVDPV